MFSYSEQLSQAAKAICTTQLSSAQAVTETAYQGGARLIELQLDAARSALAASTVAAQQLLSARDPKPLLQLSRTQSQLAMERIGSYGRQAKEVTQENQENFTAVTKGEFAASRQKFGELLHALKETPFPLINPFNNFLKSPFGAADEGYDKNTRPDH
ncbi:TIGR01841 family phasin [Janthinobacterium sp. RB2R34]|uniref:TIGR01841 family phasin n=1 Tax=Janthinobacterium sp. RB2R34 TaxID=3424193 RepID=UPI003F20DD37